MNSTARRAWDAGRFRNATYLGSFLAACLLVLLAACESTVGEQPHGDDGTLIAGAPAVVVEAQTAGPRGEFVVMDDASASGGQYLVQPPTIPASTSGTEVASVAIAIPESREYSLWARVFAPGLDSDAVYLGLNETTHRVYPRTLNSFVWLEVQRAHLAAGPHRISIGYGEPGLRLDLFAVVAAEAPTPAQLDQSIDLVDDSPKDSPGAGDRLAPSLRGDPSFNPASLSGELAEWHRLLTDAIENPSPSFDPLRMASRDDLYTYARPLQAYVQAVLVAFRVTGDLLLLDHVFDIAERMRQELRDGWRDTLDGTDGTSDGYLNWVMRYGNSKTHTGKDIDRAEEMKAHALVAMIAYALDFNRDLRSPGRRDYGAGADFWKDYLVNHFEAKWRERMDEPTGLPIMTRDGTHTYYSWTKWHYYMWRLTGDETYGIEANRMADVLWAELREVSTPSGTAYVWARRVLSLSGGAGDYLMPTTYARYVMGDVVEFHLEGFHNWASADEVRRFARTFSALMMDDPDPLRNGIAHDIGGGVTRAGLRSEDRPRSTAGIFRISSFALLGPWDASGRITDFTSDVIIATRDDQPVLLPVSALLADAWWEVTDATTAQTSMHFALPSSVR